MYFPCGRLRVRVRAKGGYVPRSEFSPVGKDRRKHGSGFGRSQMQKPMARTAGESIRQASSKVGIEARRVGNFDQREAAVRRQGWG